LIPCLIAVSKPAIRASNSAASLVLLLEACASRRIVIYSKSFAKEGVVNATSIAPMFGSFAAP
jgi:hypothetical protein